MTELPHVICMCPTYGRPKHLILNTIACYLKQDYPEDHRSLIILDDLGNLVLNTTFRERGVSLVSRASRFPSLPAKYNALRGMGFGNVQVVWEDDELYLPHHLSSCVAALQDSQWVHPKMVWSTYTGKPEQENAAGRFHAALAFRRDFLDRIGGWPETDAPDFDQQLLAVAAQNAPCGCPNSGEGEYPSYVFRWSDTHATHGQSMMGVGGEWYRSYRPQETKTLWIEPGDVRYDPDAVKALAAIRDITGK